MLRIRDWSQRYENNRSREVQKTAWVPIPNDLDTDGYTTIVDHVDGPGHYGCWVALVLVASKSRQRGCLIRDNGRPHTAESLARQIRFPVSLVEGAITRFIQEIGWLEDIPDVPQATATPSQQGATSSPLARAGAHSQKEGKKERTEGKENSAGALVSDPTEADTPSSDAWDDPFEFHEWFSVLWARQTNRGYRQQAWDTLLAHPRIRDPEWRAHFERVHAAWCNTETWRWNNGKGAPYLFQWVQDGGYDHMPVEPAVNGKRAGSEGVWGRVLAQSKT